MTGTYVCYSRRFHLGGRAGWEFGQTICWGCEIKSWGDFYSLYKAMQEEGGED